MPTRVTGSHDWNTRSQCGPSLTRMAHDIIIIGGGIIGLATGRALLAERPGLDLLVLEKESEVGRHQSGRNSGVLHSGLYYRPGSLKAELCVRGVADMFDFCDEHRVPFTRGRQGRHRQHSDREPAARRAGTARPCQRPAGPAAHRGRRIAGDRAGSRRHRCPARARHRGGRLRRRDPGPGRRRSPSREARWRSTPA